MTDTLDRDDLDSDIEAALLPAWQPDHSLVPAILAGSPVTMKQLRPPDRAWAVAVLRRMGYTAELIADWLSCSLRLVHTISADSAVLVQLYLDHTETTGNEHRMLASEVARLAEALADAEAAAERYRQQRDRLIAVGSSDKAAFPCGCPRTRYNTYVAPKTGKAGCRHHRTLAVARHRARKRQAAGVASGHGQDSIEGAGHP
ncbi:hypothetical protein HL05_gp074 [Mycobacterium phage Manad]|uniref:Uncharacterized protein n=1 Tax=Mycobacterium phage Manad TaxID=1486403 RepID=A0A059VKD8_9CAUD|nr:hypothetical protein HL05_gp074 [Mycobacterium phage Manad]AHZ95334.1 hypothetical protein PBI_MANAD_74 [Mycobacterium phage Manad]